MERLWTKSYILMIAGMLFLFTGFYIYIQRCPYLLNKLVETSRK